MKYQNKRQNQNKTGFLILLLLASLIFNFYQFRKIEQVQEDFLNLQICIQEGIL